VRRILFSLLFYCVLCNPLKLSAQWDDALVDNHHTSDKFAIGAYGDLNFSSNAVTSSFLYNFLAGNYIDNGLKQQVVNNLQTHTRIGFAFDYGVFGVLYNDTIRKKRVFNFFFALRHKRYFNTSFTPDDFKIAFYGNAMYAGKTAQLAPLLFNNLAYQQIEIGIVNTNFGDGAQFGVGLSFLGGQQYASINAQGLDLYTDTNGQYLQLNANAQANLSDTGAKKTTSINGYGASLDLYFRAPYKIGKRHGTISLSVTDLGFIWWNKNSLTYQKDSSYTYNGVVINGLTDLQNPNFNTLSKDSIESKYLPYSKGGFYSYIPTTLNINTNTLFTDKFGLEMGFTYIFNANAVGYIYAQADKYFSHNWLVALQAGYGGYTTLNSMLMLGKKFNHSSLNLKVYHLEGLVAPTKFGGAGAFIGYTQSF
jgi:hypothetical protein